MIGLVSRTRSSRHVLAAIAGVMLFASPATAQNGTAKSDHDLLTTETYVRPPAVVDRIIMAPRTDITFTTPSPDRKWFLKSTGLDRGDIAQFGKPHVNLGGLQIDTRANRARTLTTSTHLGLMLVDPNTSATKTIETPKGASISSQIWSPTGTQVAYIANFDDASHVFVADVTTGKSVQVTKTPLLATLVTTARMDGRRKEHRDRRRSRRPRSGAGARQQRNRGRTRGAAHRIAHDPAGDSPEPARGSAREGDAHVLHHGPARADRREDEDGQEDRRAGDDPRGRRIAATDSTSA